MSPEPDIERRRQARRRPWIAPLVSFGLAFGLALTWAGATPMFGVPDEITHMVRAAAAARGDIDGRLTADGSGRSYRAPAVLIPRTPGSEGSVCYAFKPQQSADCLVFSDDRGDTQIVSAASAYPPVYYLLVGWPSRLLHGWQGLYGMRAASAALFAAMVALATTSLAKARAGGAAYVGLALAATPMTWFVGSSVNASSAAIGSAIAAWCGGYLLVTADEPVAVRSFAWRFGLPLCLLLLVRRDSILWAGLMVGVLAMLLARHRLRLLLGSRHVMSWAVAALLCALYASKTGIEAGTRFIEPSAPHSAQEAFGRVLRYVTEMIGVLGWLDTNITSAAYVLWFMWFGALFVAALCFSPRRAAAAMLSVLAALVAVIVVIGSQWYPYFQGRYGLPFAVGAPLLAGLGLASVKRLASVPSRPLLVLFSAPVVISLLAYYQQLRRYAVSGESTWWLFGGVRWSPPAAPIAVFVALNITLVLALFAWWFALATFRPLSVVDPASGPVSYTR